MSSALPIVLVDDDPIDRRLIERSLASSSLVHQLISFSAGDTFLEHLANIEAGTAPMPELILLDINMPKMDGFEILHELRRREAFETVRVIMLTHSDNPKDIERARCLCAGYSEKFCGRKEATAFLEAII